MQVLERLETLQASRPHLRMFALVDGLAYEQLLGERIEQRHGCVPLFAGTPDAALSFAGPWLVDTALHMNMRDSLMGKQSLAPVVSWLFTEVPMHGLVELLQLKLDVRMPDGHTALLRFYDPRVLKCLAQTLTASQREEFFEHIQEWHFVVDGQAMRIGRADA